MREIFEEARTAKWASRSGADESELGAHEKRVEEHEQNYGQQPTEHE
jgi:hypothetical protein